MLQPHPLRATDAISYCIMTAFVLETVKASIEHKREVSSTVYLARLTAVACNREIAQLAGSQDLPTNCQSADTELSQPHNCCHQLCRQLSVDMSLNEPIPLQCHGLWIVCGRLIVRSVVPIH